ncbi:LrgB family protein [Vreelandella aquamarina]|jgi:putative effector of murein hydrolase|uniref:Putative effector of murein hydrolase n=1 Tax=Vreelandella aquamarina TaxID=77097 RepID=A0A1H8PLQ6_9GAMM|nr:MULTISPECIES: LrgB family protein [Halomonas]MCC4288966.1 LrgB family protein [Halomonas meridiana]PHR00511.1 MAG: LrgB family protein [Halomonas sp.]SEO42711.1 Putative effector of murein hydrolase [Halomonas aquamarina]HBQ06442.1 LrgB family protein [Halomonas sp.]|tara:strand:+ start:921 stop:1643 length:723 start_codon:yes stop_codon:yes gene_type:complete
MLTNLLPTLTATPLLAVGLTLAAYLVGSAVFIRLGKPSWLPAILIAALLLAAILALLGQPYATYQQGATWLTVLLGPATVALGMPLYQQLPHIHELWRPLAACLPIAAALAACYALGIAWLLGASPDILASIAAKSVTAPIAIGITEQLGGNVALLMGSLLVTGVLTIPFVSLAARLLRINDERIIGFALGLNGHAIGTVRAFDISPTAGAFASLGMSLTGIFTALLLPLAWRLVGIGAG